MPKKIKNTFYKNLTFEKLYLACICQVKNGPLYN